MRWLECPLSKASGLSPVVPHWPDSREPSHRPLSTSCFPSSGSPILHGKNGPPWGSLLVKQSEDAGGRTSGKRVMPAFPTVCYSFSHILIPVETDSRVHLMDLHTSSKSRTVLPSVVPVSTFHLRLGLLEEGLCLLQPYCPDTWAP